METDPERMDRISKTLFKDIYPLIAGQIVERCGIKHGICIDIGSGPGALAISVAKITDLNIYSLDISAKMQEIAKKNIVNEGLNHKIFPVKGDVHQLPFSENFADLIVSRGSMVFWKDKRASFREIYRVLKPDGFAYIGGGFGSAELREKIKKLSTENQNSDHVKIPKVNVEELEKILNHAEIKNYQIINDDSGLWVLFKNHQTRSI
jgi:ubiquinone/menaquinone biosynthesis C-methylase UbiE